MSVTSAFCVYEACQNAARVSTFYFDDLFLATLRAGYLKRLGLEFCLHLDRQGEALARFLYGHFSNGLGRNRFTSVSYQGFFSDIGLG